MEPRFETQTIYSKEYNYKLYRAFSIRPKYRRTRLLYLFYALVYILIMIPQFHPLVIQPLLGGTFIEQMTAKPLLVLFVLASPAITAYFLLRSLFTARLDARRGWQQRKKYEGAITSTSFFDDHISDLSNNNLTTTVAYSEVTAIEETVDFFFMLYTGGRAIITTKSDFTLGTPDEFRAFIEEKTGKKIKFIR